MDFDMGNVSAAGIIEGIGQGLGDAAKNLYTIQQAKIAQQQKQQELDADTEYKHAAANKLEAEGQITSLEADSMRDFITKQKKFNDAQGDLADSTIDTVQHRIATQAKTYHTLLNNAIQTPAGQDYIQQKRNLAQGGIPGSAPDINNPTDGSNNTASPVVNAIMPGVGAQEPDYSQSPPMSLANGGTNVAPVNNPQPTPQVQPQPAVQAPVQQQPNVQTQPNAQPSNNQPVNQFQDVGQGKDQDGNALPPLEKIFPEASKTPFGANGAQDWYMMGPKGIVAKTPEMITVENPLHLSPFQKEVVNNANDLIKSGYSPDYITNQLPQGLANSLKSVAEYKNKESEVTGGYRATPEFKQAFVGLREALYPEYDENKFTARHSYMSGLTSTSPNSVGGQVNSLNTLAMHLGELNSKLIVNQNSNIPVKNALVNFVNTNLGAPQVNDFNAAKEVFSSEMQRLLSGKAAAQAGIQRDIKNLNENSSPAQLQSVIKTYANMASDKINTLRDQYQDTMDKPEDGRILKPAAKNILNNIMGYDKFNAYDKGQVGTASSNQNNTNQKDYSSLWK